MKQANAKQKLFMSDIAHWCENYAGIATLYGKDWADSPFHLHHVKGRSFKHQKTQVGHDFIIPVPIVLHDVHSNHPLNVTHHKHAFTEHFDTQVNLFLEMVEYMQFLGYPVPSQEILNIIGYLND
jgi:hypothetical protein